MTLNISEEPAWQNIPKLNNDDDDDDDDDDGDDDDDDDNNNNNNSNNNKWNQAVYTDRAYSKQARYNNYKQKKRKHAHW